MIDIMENKTTTSFRSVRDLAIAGRWQTILANFDLESKFLRLLFEDYFINFYSSFFVSSTHEFELILKHLEVESVLLGKELKGLILLIEMMVDGKVKENSAYLEKRQIKLEIALAIFESRFADLKKKVYQLAQSASDCHERFSSPFIDRLK